MRIAAGAAEGMHHRVRYARLRIPSQAAGRRSFPGGMPETNKRRSAGRSAEAIVSASAKERAERPGVGSGEW